MNPEERVFSESANLCGNLLEGGGRGSHCVTKFWGAFPFQGKFIILVITFVGLNSDLLSYFLPGIAARILGKTLPKL